MSDESLRAKAEEQFLRKTRDEGPTPPAEKLLHELQVHQIELEMQNEELRLAHTAMEEARDRYVDLFDFSPVSYVTVSREGQITEINLTGATQFGVDRAKLISRRFSMFVSPQDSDRWHRLFLNMMEHAEVDEPHAFDIELTRGDGSTFHAHLSCIKRESGDNSPMLRLALVDISKLKQAEAELRIAAAAFESQEGILVTDADKLILRTNRAFTNITGYSAEDVIGKSPRIFQAGRQNAQLHVLQEDSVDKTGEWRGEIWNRRKSGELYPVSYAITAVKDQVGTIANYVITLTDITFAKAAEEKIKSLAFYDPLTGLPNRRLLMDRLRSALISSSRTNHKGGLLFIDLDGFKALNDTLGHDFGDLLLQQVARRLEACVREGDTVARLGGDEFVVILENLSEKFLAASAQIEAVSEKILREIARPYMLDSQKYRNSCSIGSTLISGKRRNADDLIKEADTAMYRSKTIGGNCVMFFDLKTQKSLAARTSIENELRRAISEHHLKLYYHCRVNGDGMIIGAKALIQWLHPERGLIGPEYFIPMAEEIGFTSHIEQWVLKSCCAQLKAWEQDPDFCKLVLAVNIDGKRFHGIEFAGEVLDIIRHHGAASDKLKLELTEGIFLEKIDVSIRTMNTLKQSGFQFALNDVGMGLISLQHIRQLPLNQINISQIFTHNMTTDRSSRAMARSIISMAHALEINVLALGVGTEEQRKLLLSYGCTRFEGYLFGRPKPIEQFEKELKRTNAKILA